MKAVKNVTGCIVLIFGGIAIILGSLLLWAFGVWIYWNRVIVAEFSGLPSFAFGQTLIICLFISILLAPFISSSLFGSKG